MPPASCEAAASCESKALPQSLCASRRSPQLIRKNTPVAAAVLGPESGRHSRRHRNVTHCLGRDDGRKMRTTLPSGWQRRGTMAGGSHPPVRQSCPREAYLLATSVAASPTCAETRTWGLRLPIAGAGRRHGQAVDQVVARLCQAGTFDYDGAPVISFRAKTQTSAKDLHDFVSSAG